MRTLLIFMAATMPVWAFAADIALKDGRVLKDAAVMSQTPRTVMIKYAAGLISVAKPLLPTDLQARYPVDEAAAREAERKVAITRETALKAEKAEAERVARLTVQRTASAEANNAAAETESARLRAQEASVRTNAASLARDYFENKYSWNAAGGRTCEVNIFEVRPVDGWAGRWFVSGHAVIRTYQPRSTPVNTTGMSAKEARRAEYENSIYNVETRKFEGHYSTEGSQPTIDITLR